MCLTAVLQDMYMFFAEGLLFLPDRGKLVTPSLYPHRLSRSTWTFWPGPLLHSAAKYGKMTQPNQQQEVPV